MIGRQEVDADPPLAVDRRGPAGGPLVVLLHGGGQTRHSWAGAADRLAAAGYHVVTYDARGHGDSPWAADGDYRLDRLAHDLETVIGPVHGPFALIGASLGGATAIHAVARGLRPAALILVDIVPNAERAGIDRIHRFMRAAPDGFASVEEAADAVAAYNPLRRRPADPDGLRRNLRLRNGRYHWHYDPRIIGEGAGDMRKTLEASCRVLAGVDGLATLLVRGLRSDLVSDEAVAAFRATLPTLEVADVAGAGHMIVGDRNDQFVAAAEAFLDRHLPVEAKEVL